VAVIVVVVTRSVRWANAAVDNSTAIAKSMMIEFRRMITPELFVQ
jgi:hypothetical protein